MKRSPFETLASVVDALGQELTARGTNKDMCSFTIMPGDTAIANYGAESCGGMSWVRLALANTTVSFPQSDVTVNNCGHGLAFTAEVGILRPSHEPEVNPEMQIVELPTDAEMMEDAEHSLDDMMAMHAALSAVGMEMDDFIIQSYSPIGPEGGVVGGTWVFVFGEE